MQDEIARGLAASWTEIPTSILEAELLRRQELSTGKPQCGSRGGENTYSTPLHVFALVLILVLSTLACSFPLIVRKVPRLPMPGQFLFLSRHFGTGVLIATAFVHLLPTAFTSLTDPCLPAFWNEGYPAMPGFIAMISVMVVVGIEMFFASRGAGHSHSHSLDYAPVTNNGRDTSHRSNMNNGHMPPSSDTALENVNGWSSRTNGHTKTASRKNDEGESDTESNSDLDLDELDTYASENPFLAESQDATRGAMSGPRASPSVLSDHQQQQKLLLQCLLLEAGILFHSIFIGMAVSVATGTSFIVLLVAISFHQTFEGFALGCRIAAITTFPANSPKPWLMALAYGTTTPIGQAIGLLVHNLYDPFSMTGLLMVGIMNAISSGLLLFAGLVELLAEDFLSDESYETLRGRKRLQACAAVVSGALLMALVGAWA